VPAALGAAAAVGIAAMTSEEQVASASVFNQLRIAFLFHWRHSDPAPESETAFDHQAFIWVEWKTHLSLIRCVSSMLHPAFDAQHSIS
jgi:hypothetical protein